MRKQFRYVILLGILAFAWIVWLSSCQPVLPTGYQTYSLPDKGIAHLSFDYPACFYVRQVQLYDDTEFERIDIDGPFSRASRNRTIMWVEAQRYSTPITIADLTENAAGIAEGLPGYCQKDRSTISVNGITAEQYMYSYFSARTDYETRILGFIATPTVTREIFFSYGDLQWTVGMTTDENALEDETPGFEHLLSTLTMLP